MEFITVKEAALRWKLTPRRIQGLCKEGKIPGAQRWERTWMIPGAALPPGERDPKKKDLPMPRKSPYLDMTDLYHTPGSAEETIAALGGNPEAQLLFSAEIAYSRGQIDKVYDSAQEILTRRSGFYAVISGGILLSMCAMWRGDVSLWYKARQHILEAPCRNEADWDIIALSIAAADSAIRDTRDFPEWFTHGCFDRLPRDAHPAARVYYVKHLLISAQELALGNIQLDGVYGFGLMKTMPYILEPMITQMVTDKIVLAEIYLRLLCAIAYHQYGDDRRGGIHLDKAIRLCLQDELYGPLVEHRRQLGLFLDDHLALIDPAALKIVKNLHKQLQANWTKLHNAVLDRSVQSSLSVREREVARLAAFGLSNSEIAKRLSLSDHTVISLVNSAKNKTGVENRRELGLYI